MQSSIYKTVLCLAALNKAVSGASIVPRAGLDCNDTPKHICYGDPDGTSQNLDPDDVAYAAAYLRQQGGLLNMPASTDCGEWSLYQTGTVLVLSKHLNQRVNSSVSYADVATTIDGGGDTATDATKSASLASCGTHGGQTSVLVNTGDPLYATDDYKNSHFSTGGIIIKIVKAPASSQ
ncbi:hypothetical protein SBRCBS47491_003943 [Sporothrix bragantina]|uniref:Ecp2 effector protein domain-containing protein n=1 Tax=Sporothrix bragantina TaxID=671064 RepID=A0ABP0BKI0_9PEZI